ncbi:AzlD family protein [Thiopseudomonas denitrificans]|uniref:Putative membrane protein n=1 Tax=Thiopseudomonas denitrificans TaxID=1501432 RepID=A0A4R6U5B4_9GAMM|nr:AzlD domain-containing protein [Thiopseudomonas denitrificans]TDQ40023.1 putative membrane protein [Thiopseudomonas denitrificans]
MNVETSGTGLVIIIAAMALVTLATRWGGVFVMSFVPLGYRVRLFIQAMSGSVLIAIIAPMALEGDMAARLALLTTLVVILLTRKQLLAIAAGILVAAMVRQLG